MLMKLKISKKKSVKVVRCSPEPPTGGVRTFQGLDDQLPLIAKRM
jgi:hypothetical protein